jgi:protein-S-isoprenylcysteine O-methyltransferase Ste14
VVLARLVPALVFSVFIVDKSFLTVESLGLLWRLGDRAQPTDYFLAADQVLSLLVFVTVVALFIFRLPRKSGDRRARVIAVAFFGTFAILMAGLLPDTSPGLYPASTILIAVGLGITFWGLLYLRWSFSIMPEARRLVTGGPYSWSRNPVYIGEFLAAIGIALPHAGWASVYLLAALALAQYLRILWEERVLAREFKEEYGAYRRRVHRLLPAPWSPR